MTILETKKLRHIYGEGTPFEQAALTEVDFTVESGTVVGIIGHSGSGKSTLVQHFNGLLKPTGGEVLLKGKSIWDEPKKIREVRFQVGLVFQYPEYQLFDETVEKDIAFGPKNMGLDENEIARRVAHAADVVGLSERLLKRSPFDLSGGEKRRAALAGVIAMESDVLILDEPTAGLDPRGRDSILDRLLRFQRESGTTMLIVSHSMEDMARVADKIMVLDHGRIALYDETGAVFSRAAELKALGLDVPQITGVFHGLRKNGLPVEENVYTVAKGRDTLLPLFRERGQSTC